MSLKAMCPNGLIGSQHPGEDADVHIWIAWFWTSFLPGWIERAHAVQSIGFFDLLDGDGEPAQPDRRTLLAQARLLFTFSHIALISKEPAFHEAARIAREALRAFRKAPGIYCRARSADGQPTGDPNDNIAVSYDQSFVILGLATWGRLHPDEDEDELETCWAALEDQLEDPATGLMLEHEGLVDPKAPSAPSRAQNPLMHLYEAALQAFEMTGNPLWLERAATKRAKGLEYFFDPDSGTILEFIAPDLTFLPGRGGQRREIGHQCEWAWLLMREAELGGSQEPRDIAARLLAFADQHGFAQSGAMRGAAYDAVSADANWREERFLLWPQTEAVKTHAIRADVADHAEKAEASGLLIFQRYFSGRAAFANQLDAEGEALWCDALSRLLYHLVLAFTEGARAGLWQYPR